LSLGQPVPLSEKLPEDSSLGPWPEPQISLIGTNPKPEDSSNIGTNPKPKDPNNNNQVNNTAYTTIENPINPKTVNEFIKVILEGIIKISIPVIVLALIYSGFLFVTARGMPDKLKKAKDALLYTVIGAAVLLGSWAIAQIISNTVLAL